MRLWAEALDIAHATRMKLISDETLCRGVTAIGNPVRGASYGNTERHQHEAVRLICQMVETVAPKPRLIRLSDQPMTTNPATVYQDHRRLAALRQASWRQKSHNGNAQYGVVTSGARMDGLAAM